jgi:hypothetical protein
VPLTGEFEVAAAPLVVGADVADSLELRLRVEVTTTSVVLS